MALFHRLIRLACASSVGRALCHGYAASRDVAIEESWPATNGPGEETMPNEMTGPEGERVLRWMEECPAVFEHVRRMLHVCDQIKEVARAAQTDRERLQRHCEALREEVRQLQVEVKRLQKERAEAAHWVTAMLQEAAARFPTTPTPA